MRIRPKKWRGNNLKIQQDRLQTDYGIDAQVGVHPTIKF